MGTTDGTMAGRTFGSGMTGGAIVGETVGTTVGVAVGTTVGVAVGTGVGTTVGTAVGTTVGIMVGAGAGTVGCWAVRVGRMMMVWTFGSGVSSPDSGAV